MSPYLLFPNRDFDNSGELIWNSDMLIKDLELQVLFDTMANGNQIIADIMPKILLQNTQHDISTILYRQQILKDCMTNRALINTLFELSIKAIESIKMSWYGIFIKRPTSLLHSSVGLLEISTDYLKQFRDLATQNIGNVESEGMVKLFHMLTNELGDEYLNEVGENLTNLKLYGRIHTSVRLGMLNKGVDYILRKNLPQKRNWWDCFFPRKIEGYYFEVDPRDVSGCNAISNLNDQAVNETANILAQASDHITAFFTLIRDELAFYLGCMNLSDKLKELKMPVIFPEPLSGPSSSFSAYGLYDPCLTITSGNTVISNDVEGNGKDLFIVTGANRGGKSTFLRSVGIAQLMMQNGIFVGATSFKANTVNQIFTHFKKEEDRSMSSGKFDEELRRMDEIVSHLQKGALILFNESFAATNEREGSEVASQIISALLIKGIKIFFVTHLYDFAFGYYQKQLSSVLFLQANRQEEKGKIGKLTEGYPLPTSFAKDLYYKIFH